jgi:hypothetical protein
MKFQDFYWDENGEPVTFYVGRLRSIVFSTNDDLETSTSIFIWAYNDLGTVRFKLIGAESSDGKTVVKAKRIAHILNRKAKKYMVPIDFEDWIEGIQEFTNSNLISIYPNPANENISIEYLKSIDKKSIQVIDCNGQIIYQDSNFDGEIVSTKQFYNGIYILK